ncbi:MAG: hypothetical protein JJE12_15470, partial [Anaerolineales bacterium]|nr:hypothetical protein [Anaerolineales bacterium]
MAQYFTDDNTYLPSIEQIGGKGRSLFFLGSKGLNVPTTTVMTAEFFQPWIDQLKDSPEWTVYSQAMDDGKPGAAAAVKEACQALAYSPDQQRTLSEIRDYLQEAGINLVAVRSSSPEEDLEGASFAGIYETVLGVPVQDLEEAILTCFASAFDARVVMYKIERGYDATDPKIAVIIQKQVISEVSGVAFSLNPVTNCFDEVMINANFGLGDTVVDGTVTPDQFTVDKVTNTILEIVPGSKEVSRHVKSNGGTETKTAQSISALSLSDEQVLEITSLITRIELDYDKPIDIEWAYENGQLFLLQARPITGYLKLPPRMITKPGEKKRLYQDALLTEQGLVESLSPLGEGGYNLMAEAMATVVGGDKLIAEYEEGLAYSAAGRIYTDVGRMAKLIGKKILVNSIRVVDAVGGEILENLDLKEYELDGLLPPRKLLWNTIKMAFGSIPMFINALKANWRPADYLEYFLEENEKLERDLRSEFAKNDRFDKFSRAAMERTVEYMNFIALPTLMVSERARSGIKKQFENEPQSIQDQVVYVEQAFPHNVTIEMGLLLHDLSQFPDIQETATADEFVQKLNHQQLSPEFMQKWEQFID